MTLVNREVYIYIYLPGIAEPVLAGKMASVKDAGTGQKRAFFKYGESYFTRPDRKAIDPVRLPFEHTSDHIFETEDKDGQEAFGVMYDSIPFVRCASIAIQSSCG